MKFNSKTIIWIVFIFTLIVLLPHTAWFFRQFEPTDNPVNIFGVMISWGDVVSWIAAIAFESAIAVFAHKLSIHINHTVKVRGRWRKFQARYLNAFSFGLAIAWLISTVSNYAHAIEYAKPIALFTQWGIGVNVSALVSGAILPTCSFLFARILSDVNEAEAGNEDELTEAKKELGIAKRELSNLRNQLTKTAGLFSNNKKESILAAHELWPELNNAGIAVIAKCTPAHVSKTLSAPKAPQAIGE